MTIRSDYGTVAGAERLLAQAIREKRNPRSIAALKAVVTKRKRYDRWPTRSHVDGTEHKRV